MKTPTKTPPKYTKHQLKTRLNYQLKKVILGGKTSGASVILEVERSGTHESFWVVERSETNPNKNPNSEGI